MRLRSCDGAIRGPNLWLRSCSFQSQRVWPTSPRTPDYTQSMHPNLKCRLAEIGIDYATGDAFELWCGLRGAYGRRSTLIDLYGLAAYQRGLEPEDLPLVERERLKMLALPILVPGWETTPGSGRGVPEPVELSPFDSEWSARYEAWRHLLARALAMQEPRIEHVGSTSVPSLIAKPIVDIQISVAGLEDEQEYVPAIEACGVQLRSREPQRRYFQPPAGHLRVVHIHVCRTGSAWEREHLLFRDYLRVAPEARERYARAKEDAARLWREDRIAYTEAKTDAILDILAEAEDWAAASSWTV